MSIPELLAKHRDLKIPFEVSSLYAKVQSQALRHTTRSELDELQSIARPSEESIYSKWRKDNKRNVTPDFIKSFERMLQRICSQTINVHFEKALERLVFDRLIPLSIQDTNSVVITWCQIPNDPNAIPALSDFQENMEIQRKHVVVYSHLIKYRDDDVTIWHKDHIKVGKSTHPRYLAVDKENFWIISPFYNNKKVIEYSETIWYNHGLGFKPEAELPGMNIAHILNNKTHYYKESICWPAFEWFDEGIVRLSSEQVASIKYANPKLVVSGEIQCPTCAGSGFTGSNETKSTCKTCDGKRSLFKITDFSTINMKKGHQPGDTNQQNPIYYLNPPDGIKSLQETFLMFFEMGKKSLCNDILEKTGSESGVAKEMRLEPKQDLMKSYGQQLCYLIEDLINHDILLGGGKDIITITPPVYYQTKSPDVLKLQITESLQGERFLKYMEYVNITFKGDEFNIKLHKFAALYAPLMLYKAEEFDGAYNAGVYDERDATRRDYAFYAVGEVLRKEPNLEKLKDIKEKADAFLISEGVLKEIISISPDDDLQRSKLLDTVGGG